MAECAEADCSRPVEMMAYTPYCSQLCARAAGEEIRSLRDGLSG